jgi:hypothetical protein
MPSITIPPSRLFRPDLNSPVDPVLGAWVSYGIGSENENLPAFVVLLSQAQALKYGPAALSPRLWSGGFLPSSHQGVRFRSGSDPVLYLADPPGVSRTTRREMLDAVRTP